MPQVKTIVEKNKIHMKNLFKIWIALLFVMLNSGISLNAQQKAKDFDVVVYGGTSAGIAAAVQSSRMDKSVVLIEPTQRIGGLTTGGLGATDIGNKEAIGGIAREFYENIYEYYEDPANWEWQKKSNYKQGRNEEGEDAMWTFEPSAALEVYKEMIAKEDIDLLYGARLNRKDGVVMNGKEIESIEMEDGSVYQGKMFIDATYEGDLMAAAGVEYTVGREPSHKYGESLNGVQLYPEGLPEDIDPIKVDYFSRSNRGMHQFPDGVDPYKVPGDPENGLLWGISEGSLQPISTGDDKAQAYNIRMALTDHPENQVPITKPAGYDPAKYELLVRLFEAQPESRGINDYFIWSRMPNRKTDINNGGAFSTDMIGMNYEWPEASYEQREEMFEDHVSYIKGLLYFYKTDPRIPTQLKEFVSSWGYPKDEYLKNDHFSPQLYVREGRRMIGDYVMTQNNVIGNKVAQESIGMAAYGMDSHHIQRIVVDGMVKNEGDIQVHDFPPYPIAYGSITPKESEVTNLLVPVSLSASHIAFGSIRMEPVFMVLGQSAALAGSIAIDQKINVQDIKYEKLEKVLLRNNQRLKWNRQRKTGK